MSKKKKPTKSSKAKVSPPKAPDLIVPPQEEPVRLEPPQGCKVARDLWHLVVPISTLTPAPVNSRIHSDRNIEAIKMSLDRYRQRQPIVVKDGVVKIGNGRLRAAIELGWTAIAVVDASDLSDEEIEAYAIADNKTAELAEWDYATLASQLGDLSEEARPWTGFADFEIEPLLQAEWKPPATIEGDVEIEGRPVVIQFTPDQWPVIKRAIDAIRAGDDGPPDATDGRCLELICADYLSGVPVETPTSTEATDTAAS